MIDENYQLLVEYSKSNGSNSIKLEQTDDTIWFHIDGFLCAQNDIHTDTGVLYNYRFGVTHDNLAYVLRDGIFLALCSGMPHPSHVEREHHALGTGPSIQYNRVRHQGLILDPVVRHWLIPNPFFQRTEFVNYPGQVFDHGFEVSFYARWNDITTRSNQRAFEFSNGAAANDAVWCGQLGTTATMECGLTLPGSNGAATITVTAVDAIQEGVFALWRFGVDADGTTAWIERNDRRMNTAHFTGFTRTHEFRRNLLLGESSLESHDTLDGVVAGFRLWTN